MRTSLNEIKYIEQYLEGTLDTPEQLLVEARIITDSAFRFHVVMQRTVLNLVRIYHHNKTKEEVSRHTETLFNDPIRRSYQNEIKQLFKTKKP